MPYASPLVGRSFSTRLERPEEPAWGPLEAVARLTRATPELPSLDEAEFMYMAAVRQPRKRLTIHLYKHVHSRRYLNLDDAGHAYAFVGVGVDDASDAWSGGRYRRYRSLRDALWDLQLWMFDGWR